MARKRTTKVIGIIQLERRLVNLSRSMPESVLRKATLNGAEPILQSARNHAPRDTGFLSDKGIQVAIVEADNKHADAAIGLIPEAFYGKFQELGTAHMRPHPFLRPAFDEQKSQAERGVKEVLGDHIRTAALS